MIRPIGLLLCTALCLSANVITLDFEGFPDGTVLSTQYPNVTFSNAIILSSGISLNEFEFPPHFGTNIVSDDGGSMFISFATPILSFSGYFTYAQPLILQAFDTSSNQIANAASVFSNNMALSGDPGSSPNEFIQLSFAGGISGLRITGDAAGGSFVLDDMTYSTGAVSSVPEPSSGSLLVLPCCLMAVLLIRRRLSLCRSNTLRTSLMILAVLGGLPAFGQHTLGGTYVSPRLAVVGQPTQIRFQVSIPDSALIPGSVNLLRLTSYGSPTIIGTFHDDGLNGDSFAGDGVFTWQGTLTESTVGQVGFQVSAAFRGVLQRVRSDFMPLTVQAPDAPAAALGALAATLAAGNIATALSYFEDSDGANSILNHLDQTGLLRLSAAFAAAHLVAAPGDLRLYASPWTAANGHSLNLEFTLGLDVRGHWVIVTW